MSESINIFDSIKQLIIEKFDIILTAVKQRREALFNELETIRVAYNSKNESKLNTFYELEQMRVQMTAMYVHQNRAAQVQEAAIRPINEEIEAIKLTLTDRDYTLEFQLNIPEIVSLITSLGMLVESNYGTLEKPPVVPPRTPNVSRSSSPTLQDKRVSVPMIESMKFYPKPNLRSSHSCSADNRELDILEYEEVELATVIPRVISNPQICEKPQMPIRTSVFSNKQRPIYTTCERGDGQQNIRTPMGLVYHRKRGEGLIYVLDLGLHKILVLSENGEFVSEFGQNVLERPVAIATCEDSCFVIDEALNAVVKYRLSDYVIIGSRRYRMGSHFGEMSQPKGLDSDSREFLFIADSGNNRVCMLDSSLLFVKILFDGKLQSPQDVKIIDGNIYVLDRNPVNCLHSFTRSGIPIQSVISRGNTLPSFLCSDSSGKKVIISDQVSIRMFSLDGDPICIIGEHVLGWDSGVSEPMGLCVTKDNIVVCAYARGEDALYFY